MGSIETLHDIADCGIETEAIPNAVLARLAHYLAARPARSQIDPVDMAPDLLPNLFVLVVEPAAAANAPRMRIRLTGTALDRAFGRCLKGSFLEDFLHGPRSADVLAGFRHCADGGEAVWMRQVVKIGDRVPRFVEGVAFPVDPDLIYGGLAFGEAAGIDIRDGFELRTLMFRPAR
jgi:hypothetical protein